MADSGNTTGRDAAILALASGASVRSAAATARVSERTLHRWLKEDAGFAREVESARDNLFEATFAQLVGAGSAAVTCVTGLLQSDSDQVRLGAARAILDQLGKSRETLELQRRIRQVEDNLTEGPRCVTSYDAA